MDVAVVGGRGYFCTEERIGQRRAEPPQKRAKPIRPGRSACALFGPVRAHLPQVGLSYKFGFLHLHMWLFGIIIPAIKIECLVI
jgi:hypothetical protein